MKFGKEFTSQMVPEWQEAYMNYNHLKTILKEILIFRGQRQKQNRKQSPPPHTPSPKSRFTKRKSLYRAFSGLTNRYDNVDDAIIATETPPAETQSYRTLLHQSSEEGAENELAFFKALDDEFNKVNVFYRGKVEEAVMEAEELNKQMDALVALRVKINDPNFQASSASLNSGLLSPLEKIDELEKNPQREQSKMVSLEILNSVKINIIQESAISTLKNMLIGTKSNLSFNKGELRNVQTKLKQAFVEFHRKLRLLKNNSFLNQLAFSKILKKYDKITSRNASKGYLEMVENSYLGQSDEVVKLMERVEAAFIKHFANANRRQGMRDLRPRAKRDKHRLTFFIGKLNSKTEY
ncbi:hypothetical protein LXL04_013381 [Taraxacum kok-saghyz]